jgi:hypothetical protein
VPSTGRGGQTIQKEPSIRALACIHATLETRYHSGCDRQGDLEIHRRLRIRRCHDCGVVGRSVTARRWGQIARLRLCLCGRFHAFTSLFSVAQRLGLSEVLSNSPSLIRETRSPHRLVTRSLRLEPESPECWRPASLSAYATFVTSSKRASTQK